MKVEQLNTKGQVEKKVNIDRVIEKDRDRVIETDI